MTMVTIATMPTSKRFLSPRQLRGIGGVAACMAIWEIFAHSGLFSTALTPPLEDIARTLVSLVMSGTLFVNAAYTLARVAFGMGLAFVTAVPLGFLMARSRFVERFIMPLVSVLLPIPSLAWVPLFTLWLGIGDTATICVVVYAAFFPLLYNVWAGVRSVNPLWIRSAQAMGAGRWMLYRQVIWPGALPYVITGLRLSLGRAWIGVIGGELLASPVYGLGQLIFNAKEFLNASVMLSVLLFIGVMGVIFERFVFQPIEARTVRRWGMTSGS